MTQENVLNIIKLASAFLVIGFLIYSIIRAGGISAIFVNFVNLVNGAESAWLNLAAAVIPYGVSLIPATLTFQHVMTELGFNFWTAVDAGVVVELFGVVAMQTIIKFWQNNKKYTSNKSENRAPLGLAIFAYSFYLVIVMVVNVVLEIIAGSRSFWGIVAIGLFSLLGIPSGILVAIRSQHREMLDERKAGRVKSGQPQIYSEPQQPQGKKQSKPASKFKEQMITMLDKEYQENQRVLELTEITSRLRLDHSNSKGFVSTVRSNWMQKNGIQKSHKDGLTF